MHENFAHGRKAPCPFSTKKIMRSWQRKPAAEPAGRLASEQRRTAGCTAGRCCQPCAVHFARIGTVSASRRRKQRARPDVPPAQTSCKNPPSTPRSQANAEPVIGALYSENRPTKTDFGNS